MEIDLLHNEPRSNKTIVPKILRGIYLERLGREKEQSVGRGLERKSTRSERRKQRKESQSGRYER